MTTISASTILRSRNTSNKDKILSTLLLRYPRWVHAEFMTHRVFSRNAASSRAIPFKKMVEDIRRDPAVPLYWGMNIAGMQAKEELPTHMIDIARQTWLDALDAAIVNATYLTEMEDQLGVVYGLHKQIVNRLLEPFAHITVVVSGTEWTNFIALRNHPDAEPHIAMLAREIIRELDRTDNITDLEPGEWHLPFVTEEDRQLAQQALENPEFGGDPIWNILIPKSVACCASTSYKTVDGFDMSIERAVALHDKLVAAQPIHASPCEHVAQADQYDPFALGENLLKGDWEYVQQHGNFQGFRQYRKMLPFENL